MAFPSTDESWSRTADPPNRVLCALTLGASALGMGQSSLHLVCVAHLPEGLPTASAGQPAGKNQKVSPWSAFACAHPHFLRVMLDLFKCLRLSKSRRILSSLFINSWNS